MSGLRVAHLNTHDQAGGAAVAARRLHEALLAAGVRSRMIVRHVDRPDATIVPVAPPSSPARVARRLRGRMAFGRYRLSRDPHLEIFSDDRSEFGALAAGLLSPGELVHLHWIAGLFDHRAFFAALGADRPLVWTLHDMGPFTGGCHYSGDCDRFTERCGRCPQLGSSAARDLSRRIWERKAQALAGLDPTRVRIVSPGRWLADEARRSALLGRFDVEVVPHGLDPAEVGPRDRAEARAALGIGADARVVMFAAVGVDVPRKGAAELVAALRSLDDVAGLRLLVVGGGAPPQLSGLPVHELGFVDDLQRLVDAYCAADVFAMPSLSEAFGLTALEAQACACPVVGFDTGGIGDIVRSGHTGELVARGDIPALASALRRVLGDPRRARAMGRAGRARVESTFTLAQQAHAYRAVYDALSPGSGHG